MTIWLSIPQRAVLWHWQVLKVVSSPTTYMSWAMTDWGEVKSPLGSKMKSTAIKGGEAWSRWAKRSWIQFWHKIPSLYAKECVSAFDNACCLFSFCFSFLKWNRRECIYIFFLRCAMLFQPGGDPAQSFPFRDGHLLSPNNPHPDHMAAS